MSLFEKLFARSRASATPTSEEDWLLAERNADRGISLLRIRKLPRDFSFVSHVHRMSITWTYRENAIDGAPQESEIQFMQRFELRLAEKLEGRSAALLALVFTEPRFRQWEYYARSESQFMKLLNRVAKEPEPYPITISHVEDPEGKFYHSYTEGVA